MWPIVFQMMRTYAPYITLPIAGVVGFIGYNIENVFRKPTVNRPSTETLRDERLIDEMIRDRQVEGKVLPDALSKKTFVPDTIFGKNVSPGLAKAES